MLLINDPKKAATCEKNTKLKPIIITSQKTRPSIEETGQVKNPPLAYDL